MTQRCSRRGVVGLAALAALAVVGPAWAQTPLTAEDLDRVHAGAFSFSWATSATTPEGSSATAVVSGGEDGLGFNGLGWGGFGWGGFDVAGLEAALAVGSQARTAPSPAAVTVGAVASGDEASASASLVTSAGGSSAVSAAATVAPPTPVASTVDRAIVATPAPVVTDLAVPTVAYDWTALVQSLSLSFGWAF